MNNTNSAYRLLEILKKGKKISNNTNCKTAWGIIFKVHQNSPDLLTKIAKAMMLPGIIIEEINENYPNQLNTTNHWNNQISSGFIHQNLSGQWSTFIDKIDEHSINYLELHATMLQGKAQNNAIDENTLFETREKLNEILESLMQEEIDIKIKKCLARNIRKLIEAIDEFELTGTIEIFDAMEVTIGHFYFDKNYAEYIKDSDLGKKLLITLGTLADVITLTLGYPQISEGFKILIGNISN